MTEPHAGLKRTATVVTLGILASTQWAFVRTLKNDAFVDEATYISAGRLLRSVATTGPDAPPSFATYFSGAPHLYPRLAEYADRLGGLDGARLLSFVCIVVAMLAVYAAARHLFRDRAAGVAAAAMFAMQAPVLFLARLATFDAACVALLALALAGCAVASTRERRTTALAAVAFAGGCIGAASVIKYASALYVPCIVLLVVLLLPRYRWSAALVTIVAASAVAGLLVLPANPTDVLQGFIATTLSRTTVSGGGTLDILWFAARLGGIMALCALPITALRTRVPRAVAVTLMLFALAAPLNHARLHEFVSLHKHVAFSLALLAPLAGGALALGARWAREELETGSAVVSITAICVVCVLILRLNTLPSLTEARALYTYWPNVARRTYQALRPLAQPDVRILSEEPDLGWFYVGSSIPYARWTHPYYFRHNGRVTTVATDSAQRHAIRDGYFAAVVLRYGPQRTWARSIERELLGSQPQYRLALRVPFALADGPGAYEVWVREGAPGATEVR